MLPNSTQSQRQDRRLLFIADAFRAVVRIGGGVLFCALGLLRVLNVFDAPDANKELLFGTAFILIGCVWLYLGIRVFPHATKSPQ
jgi:hypothetical protein